MGISPISSRSMVPPFDCSNFPILRAAAPVLHSSAQLHPVEVPVPEGAFGIGPDGGGHDPPALVELGEPVAHRRALVGPGDPVHPDHPNRPSEFDRTWAVPWFSYIITSVKKGRAVGSRSWRLTDDREKFNEEKIVIMETVS